MLHFLLLLTHIFFSPNKDFQSPKALLSLSGQLAKLIGNHLQISLNLRPLLFPDIWGNSVIAPTLPMRSTLLSLRKVAVGTLAQIYIMCNLKNKIKTSWKRHSKKIIAYISIFFCTNTFLNSNSLELFEASFYLTLQRSLWPSVI